MKIRAWSTTSTYCFQHETPRAVCLAWVRAQCLQCQVGEALENTLDLFFRNWDTLVPGSAAVEHGGYMLEETTLSQLKTQEQWIQWWVCDPTCKCQKPRHLTVRSKHPQKLSSRMNTAGFFCDFCSKACNDEAATNEPTAGHATCHEIARTLWGEKGLVWLMAMSAAILPKGASHEPGECTSCWAEYVYPLRFVEDVWTKK